MKKIFEDNNIFFYNIDYKISSGQSWSKQNFPFLGNFFSRSPFKIKTERVELNEGFNYGRGGSGNKVEFLR